MNGEDIIAAVSKRLALAYGLDTQVAATAISDVSSALGNVDPFEISFERHGGIVLLIRGGDVIADLDLADDLPPIAWSCDTLDPYGDRAAVAPVPRIPPLYA